MKRSVMAVLISAMLFAAAAASVASCIWMSDSTGTEQETTEGPDIPLDEVLQVEEVIEGNFLGDTVWVKGCVVGGLLADGTVDFDCAGEVQGTAVVLADDAGCTDADECLVLKLTKKAHKEALAVDGGRKDDILHHTLYIRGKVTTYKKMPALTNLSDFKLE